MSKSQRNKTAKCGYDDRQNHRKEGNIQYDNFDNIFTYQHFYDALRKCKKGVNWKNSVQKYDQHAISEIDKAMDIIKAGHLPKFTSTRQIKISERGKIRTIVPITINDRMVQRVLCDYALVPAIRKTLIYDNGASLSGKGVDFSRHRLEKHIKEAQREYGNDFYALVFDFKSYFDSIPHKTCRTVLERIFTDQRIIDFTMEIIKSYQRVPLLKQERTPEIDEQIKFIDEEKSAGICLGSQVSQVMALVVPNKLDHFIKDDMRIKHYLRYMDDGIILSNDKKLLNDILVSMEAIVKELGLNFSIKKTHIVKMSRGFTFMKIHYFITPEGKIVKTLTRPGITRMRRKLKKFRHLVDIGKLSCDDVYNSIQSWIAHAEIAMSYKSQRTMMRLYNELFDGYKITKKYEHCKGGKSNELLQDNRWDEFSWDSYIAGYEAFSG